MYQSNAVTSLEICSVNDIHTLNNMKQYTITSTYLLKTILTDTHLTPTAAHLWQYLYSIANADDNLEIKISYRKLAFIFSKSTRTIARYVSNLVENGYIVLKHNSLSNGGYDSNTIQVRFPQHIIANAKKTPDRRSHHSKQSTSPSGLGFASSKLHKNNCSTYNIQSQNCFDNKNGLEQESNETPNASAQLRTHQQTITDAIVCDKNVSRGYDTSVTQINTSNKNILNNNVVVDDSIHTPTNKLASKTTTDSIAQELEKVEKELASLYLSKPINPDNSTNWYDEMKRLRSHISTLETLLLRETNGTNQIHTQVKSADVFDNNQDYITYLGSRPVNDFHIKRIRKELSNLDISESRKLQLINEIIYEVRFGTLRVKKSNQNELSIAHGINIALKLIRESRWETPI